MHEMPNDTSDLWLTKWWTEQVTFRDKHMKINLQQAQELERNTKHKKELRKPMTEQQTQ